MLYGSPRRAVVSVEDAAVVQQVGPNYLKRFDTCSYLVSTFKLNLNVNHLVLVVHVPSFIPSCSCLACNYPQVNVVLIFFPASFGAFPEFYHIILNSYLNICTFCMAYSQRVLSVLTRV